VDRVPRNIFGLKKEEITADWKRLRKKELHGLYSSPTITASDQR
jgi:hypothetical protein